MRHPYLLHAGCALTTTDCQKPETTASGRTEVTADAAGAAFLTKTAAAAVNNV